MIFGPRDKFMVIRFFSSVDDANALRFFFCELFSSVDGQYLVQLAQVVLPPPTEAAGLRQLSIANLPQSCFGTFHLESGHTNELNMCSELRTNQHPNKCSHSNRVCVFL